MDELSRLLADAQAGRPGALESFVGVTYPSVRRFCAHLIGDDDAEDATQETYVALWRGLASFRGDVPARTWLFLVARHEAERVGRRRNRWREVGALAGVPPANPQPGTRIELAAQLSCLDPERRAAFVLTQLLGFSYAEAATVCDCPVGTVRSRVARAREQLLRVESDEATGSLGG